MYNLKTKTSCELPDLPVDRVSHTSVGGIICGGGYVTAILTSCIDITKGTWSSSYYQPTRTRRFHVTWNINPGESFMLLGSWDNKYKRTTDIVHRNGTVTPGFNLKYST